ncbi:MAG: SHOCT domain-containing protein [Mycobacterium sp.]
MCGWNGYGGMWNGGYGSGWGWVGWIITAIVLVVFFAVLITAVVVAARSLTGGHRGPGGHQVRGAEDVLAERFARGEIDADEYRQRVTLLREHR